MNKIKEKLASWGEKIEHSARAKKIIVSCFCIVLLVFAYCVINYGELIAVYNLQSKVSHQTEDMEIAMGGEVVGIKLLATGVLVMGLDRQDTNLEVGDIILKVDSQKIETNIELSNLAKDSQGRELELTISRQGKEFTSKVVPILDSITNEYKMGIWGKDSSAGVGTITFYDKKTGKFAALGHGVTETRENYILPITVGGITKTTIYSIKKGISKIPGELKGTISNETIGDIVWNTDKGIYGVLMNNSLYQDKKTMKIMPKSKIKEGRASIYCTLDDNQVKEYEIEIEKVLLTSSGNKNMIIRVTDEELIEKTGGIIQGMSGSPIVQDGKLVGAVTHVFLNDPTRGYGVFVENMIEDMSSIE